MIQDSSKGTIQINSIGINQGTPGITNPDEWSGVYFSEIPISITAIPQDGYSFAGWRGILEGASEYIEIVLTEDITIEPIFIKN